MNEREASLRTCPLLKRRCMTDDCMMWRWFPAKTYTAAIRAPKDKPTEGYCGLAGMPHV